MSTFARELANAFLAGDWTSKGLAKRGVLACGQRLTWLKTLTDRVLAAFPEPSSPGAEAIISYLLHDEGFRKNWQGTVDKRRRQGLSYSFFWSVPEPFVRPAWLGASTLPALTTTSDLAAWSGLKSSELDWFADCGGWGARGESSRLEHYCYRWIPKRGGAARLLEMPKHRLKSIQRRILHEILDPVPLHPAAHGYRAGHSILDFASPHAGRDIVLRFDLRNFFPSIPAGRVHQIFRTMGYPPGVARLLTGLCTNIVPDSVRMKRPFAEGTRELSFEMLYHVAHLPQGAPTSPALANLCAHRFDCRITALAAMVQATYTRYADDLAFSGGPELERAARRFQVAVCRIALAEGFEVHTRKSRFMRQGVRQQLAGILLNVHPNLRREEYDTLKAILHNCRNHGAQAENREQRPDFRGYLLGRISYFTMINPVRGQKLKEAFDQIEWE